MGTLAGLLKKEDKMETEAIIILDGSGSMQTIQDDTVGSYNGFLDQQKRDFEKDGIQRKITLVRFSGPQNIETLYSGTSLALIEPMTLDAYNPRGSTALLDAIGLTVKRVGERLDEIPKDQQPKMILVILTDGEENASERYHLAEIKSLIIRLTEVYKWDVFFLGANMDAFEVSASLGISSLHTSSFDANSKGIHEAFSVTSSSITNAARTAKNTP